ncbi:hypothetical protein B0H19DRAFT_1121778 [Mycena capillaripes]|nr:hypothetical protein B0H19DRAFT_1121778 [Mycena capillaripes]
MGGVFGITTRTSLFCWLGTGVDGCHQFVIHFISDIFRASLGFIGGQVIKPEAWIGVVFWDRDEDVAMLLGGQMWWYYIHIRM